MPNEIYLVKRENTFSKDSMKCRKKFCTLFFDVKICLVMIQIICEKFVVDLIFFWFDPQCVTFKNNEYTTDFSKII